MKKQALSIQLCLLLALSLLPSTALAAGTHSITLSCDTASAATGASPRGSVALPDTNPYAADADTASALLAAADNTVQVADTAWYVGHEGNESFIIYTAAQLAGLAKLVNEGVGFQDKLITLGDNIDLSGANWTPIGDEEGYPFKGTFDGNGKTVSNLSISSVPWIYAALFGRVQNARIENLTVDGNVTTGVQYAAGIVAHAMTSHIENCSSAVEIGVAGDRAVSHHVGGIAAHMEGRSGKTIVGCSNTGDITLTNVGDAWAGGIVGYIFNDRVYNSYNTGDISVSGSVRAHAGGVAGEIYQSGGLAYIANCYSIANVAIGPAPQQALVGESINGRVVNSYGYSQAGGSYYAADGSRSEKSLDELKALGDALNRWVREQTDLTLEGEETPFALWHTSPSYNGGCPCFTQYVAPPVPATADYDYTLTFNANGGNTINSLSLTEYTTIDLTLAAYTPLRRGYTFTGWYLDPELTNKVASIRLTRNTTLYAGWADDAKRLMPPQTGGSPGSAHFLSAVLFTLGAAILCAAKQKRRKDGDGRQR